MSTETDQPNLADVIAENREVFETIADEAEDPTVAERFGRKPLRYLEGHDAE